MTSPWLFLFDERKPHPPVFCKSQRPAACWPWLVYRREATGRLSLVWLHWWKRLKFYIIRLIWYHHDSVLKRKRMNKKLKFILWYDTKNTPGVDLTCVWYDTSDITMNSSVMIWISVQIDECHSCWMGRHYFYHNVIHTINVFGCTTISQ